MEEWKRTQLGKNKGKLIKEKTKKNQEKMTFANLSTRLTEKKG
jgi:hypothetical protein